MQVYSHVIVDLCYIHTKCLRLTFLALTKLIRYIKNKTVLSHFCGNANKEENDNNLSSNRKKRYILLIINC